VGSKRENGDFSEMSGVLLFGNATVSKPDPVAQAVAKNGDSSLLEQGAAGTAFYTTTHRE
jgi:hypothetical protein